MLCFLSFLLFNKFFSLFSEIARSAYNPPVRQAKGSVRRPVGSPPLPFRILTA